MKKVILFLVLIVIILAGIQLIESKSTQLKETPKAQKPHFSVNIVKAELKTVKETSSFIAKLESNNAPKIATKVSGFIEHVHVSENQVVKKGDLLVDIDSKELQESLSQIKNSIKSLELSIQSVQTNLVSLQTDLEASKNALERDSVLLKIGGLSKEKYENSQLKYELKKAQLNSTLKNIEAKKYELKAMKNSYDSKQASFEYYHIKSPIDGVVERVVLKRGDIALAGKTILTLLGKTQKLTFSFSNSEIKEGLEVVINNSIKTTITKVLKESDNFLPVAQISLNTTLDLPVGSFVNVQVTRKSLHAFAFPINTILHKSDGTYIVIYENDTFKFHPVEILAENEDYVITKENISQKVALASESKLAILPSSNNYMIMEK